MAKKDLELKITADTEKAIQAMARTVDKQEVMIQKLRKTNREGKETKKTLSGFSSVAGDIGKIAGGFGLATGAMKVMRETMGALIKELEDLRRKETEAAQATQQYAKTFSETIGDWLGAGKIDEAHAAMGKLVKQIPELGYTTGEAMLSAYGGAKPKAGLAGGMEAVRLGAPLAWGRVETMKLVGELEELFPEKEREDIFDIAIGLRKRAGKRKEEIEPGMKGVHKLTSIGIPPEQALGALMTAFGEEQAGRAVGTLATVPSYFGKAVKRTPGKRLTEEERIQLETGGMNEAEIFNWALANPEKVKTVMKTTWPTIAPMMKPGAIETGTEMIGAIQAEDEYQKRLAAERKSHLATTARISMRRDAAVEQLRMGYTRGAMVGFTRQTTEDLLKSMPDIGATEREWMLGAIEVKGRIGGDYTKTAIANLSALQQRFARPTLPTMGGYGGVIIPERPSPHYDPAMAEAVGGLIRDIREQAGAYEGMADLNQQQQANEEHTKALREHTLALKEQTQVIRTTIVNVNHGMLD